MKLIQLQKTIPGFRQRNALFSLFSLCPCYFILSTIWSTRKDEEKIHFSVSVSKWYILGKDQKNDMNML